MRLALYPLTLMAITSIGLIRAEVLGKSLQIFFLKPVTTFLVIMAGVLSFQEPVFNPLYTVGILLGLLFSLGGDVTLMFQEKPKAFKIGLVLFLAAHITYSFVFGYLGSISFLDIFQF